MTTLRFDGNSELVAELVTANGFKSAYAIKDGAEGPRGWLVCVAVILLLFVIGVLLYLNYIGISQSPFKILS